MHGVTVTHAVRTTIDGRDACYWPRLANGSEKLRLFNVIIIPYVYMPPCACLYRYVGNPCYRNSRFLTVDGRVDIHSLPHVVAT